MSPQAIDDWQALIARSKNRMTRRRRRFYLSAALAVLSPFLLWMLAGPPSTYDGWGWAGGIAGGSQWHPDDLFFGVISYAILVFGIGSTLLINYIVFLADRNSPPESNRLSKQEDESMRDALNEWRWDTDDESLLLLAEIVFLLEGDISEQDYETANHSLTLRLQQMTEVDLCRLPIETKERLWDLLDWVIDLYNNRYALDQMVVVGAPPYTYDLFHTLLKTQRTIGDRRSLPRLRELETWGDPTGPQARAIRAEVEARLKRMGRNDQLLRPAQEPREAHLVKPAHAVPTDADRLVQPVPSPPTSPKEERSPSEAVTLLENHER